MVKSIEVDMKQIVLASSSPRRSELLRQVGLEFKVVSSGIDEVFDARLTPEELVQELSRQKASDVAEKLKSRGGESFLVIGADTVVVKDAVLGKPKDNREAFEMLRTLSGQWHEVITGITVIDTADNRSTSSFEKTRVKMREITDREIQSYIRTGEPLDKAGAYGIQGMGAVLVEKIEGCYFTVVGLPLAKLATLLNDFGIQVLE